MPKATIRNIKVGVADITAEIDGHLVTLVEVNRSYYVRPECGPVELQYVVQVATPDSLEELVSDPTKARPFFYAEKLTRLFPNIGLKVDLWGAAAKVRVLCDIGEHSINHMALDDSPDHLRALERIHSPLGIELLRQIEEALHQLSWDKELWAEAEIANCAYRVKKLPEHRDIHEAYLKHVAEDKIRREKADADAKAEGATHAWIAVAHIDGDDRVFRGYCTVTAAAPEARALSAIETSVRKQMRREGVTKVLVESKLFPL